VVLISKKRWEKQGEMMREIQKRKPKNQSTTRDKKRVCDQKSRKPFNYFGARPGIEPGTPGFSDTGFAKAVSISHLATPESRINNKDRI
jgi:hypothetical protein